MATAKSSRSRVGHSGILQSNGMPGGAVASTDTTVQLTDMLQIFKSESFDPDGYVQSKCQTMSEKEIRHLCSHLQDLKRASAEEMRKSVYANYAAFIRTSKEISDLEGELLSIRNLLSTQAALIHGLAEGVHVESLSSADSNEDEVSHVEDKEPSDIERWALEFPDILDVLLAERRVDEALAAFDEGEKIVSAAKEKESLNQSELSSLQAAIADRRRRLADQLADAASQSSTRGVELRAAASALKRLGDAARAHHLILTAHGQRLHHNLQTIHPRPAILRSNLCDSMARYILVLLFLCAVIAEAAPPPPPPRFRIIPRGGTAQEVAGSSITPEAYWHQALPSTDIPIAFRSSLLTDSKLATPAWWRGIYGFIIPSPIGGVNVTLPNFNYQYAATQTQVRANANSTIFFRQTDLVAGSKMRVNFAAPASAAKFLPRSVADSVPFSSAKLPEILSLLSVKPRSAEADIVRKTLKRCEETPLAGETRFCATSLESVVDFSTVSLGSRDLAAVSTVVTSGKPSKQVYTIEPSGVKKLADGGALACHPEKYAYAVFYCHTAPSTKAYTVSLAGAEGTKVEAVVACHTDTSKWNPKHIAFQMLKVKPGTVPVCHFLPPDHVVIARSH